MKPWMSWALFLIACALIAFFVVDSWGGRIIAWLWMTVPILFWVKRCSRR